MQISLTGENKDIAKVQKLLKVAPSSGSKAKLEGDEPPCKKIKQEPVDESLKGHTLIKLDSLADKDSEDEGTGLQPPSGFLLSKAEKSKLVEGEWLNDKYYRLCPGSVEETISFIGWITVLSVAV